jgi:hypothetical protein
VEARDIHDLLEEHWARMDPRFERERALVGELDELT